MEWCCFLVVYLGLCRILFRKAFSYDEARVAQVMSLNEKDAIENRLLLLKAGGVLLLGAGLLVATAGLSPTEYLSEAKWPTWSSSPACSSWSGGSSRSA